MNSIYDLIIQQAHLRGNSDGLVEIGVSGGKIVEISAKIEKDARINLNTNGNLVTESFVNPHLHLCKVYTLEMASEDALKDYHGADMGKAMTAIELAARVKESYHEEWIIKKCPPCAGRSCPLRQYTH